MDTKKLKQKILDLAIRGKLVPQAPNDEPASVLLEQIRQKKECLIKEKKIKRDKNESHIYRSGKSYYEKRGSDMRCIDDEIPFEIPESWSWCKLGQITSLISGQDFPPDKCNVYGEGIPYIIGASNIIKSRILITRWTTTPCVLANKGDLLLVCKGAGVGKICECNLPKAHIARQIQAIRVHGNLINIKYIKHLLICRIDEIISGANGLIPGLNRELILDFFIPLPPLTEQQRIVESIEQAFALIDSIDTDKSDLSKAIKQTKTKVLDLAIRGELVPQDPNDEPASILLERIKAEKQASVKDSKKQQKQSVITSDNSHYPFDIPSNWVWCKFGDISDYGKCINAQPEQIDSNDWVLDLEDIEKDTGRVLAYITYKERKSASSKHIFKKGQLLYSKLRPYLNKVVIAEFDGFCTSEIIPIDFKGYIAPKYGQAYLMSPFFLEYANILSYGVKMPRMGTDDGKKANIPLPPFAEQQRITAKIDKIFRQLNSIEEALKA